MKVRAQGVIAVLVAAAVGIGGSALESRVGPASRTESLLEPYPISGAWFCPHGGGEQSWIGSVTLANPGGEPVRVRVRPLGQGTAEPVALQEVPPRGELTVVVPVGTRDAGTVVEYFGGWVGAAWTTLAFGEERGMAAEPCTAAASRSWLLPDGTTEQGQQAYVVVMNPFAVDAVLSLVLVTEDRRIRTEEWTNVVLPAGESSAFHLNIGALGERTVAADVEVSIGRVVAASLGVVETGGVRSAVGVSGGPRREVLLPGAGGTSEVTVTVMNPGQEGAAFSTSVRGLDPDSPAQGIPEEVLPPASAATYALVAADPSLVTVRSVGDSGVVAARRSTGSSGDQASTAGAGAARSAWLVMVAHPEPGAAIPFTMLLANPGDTATLVSLAALSPEGGTAGEPVTVEIAAGSVAIVPDLPAGSGSYLAVSEEGSFVPVVASSGTASVGYALALGVPIPAAFTPVTP
jgi:Family of unknown function (DUF5719)